MRIMKVPTSAQSRQQRRAKLGKTFEAYRLSRNIRQEDLAESAGIARSTLARLEKDGSATLDTTLRVLEALGLEDRVDLLLPEIKESPLDMKSGERQRATGVVEGVMTLRRGKLVGIVTQVEGDLPAKAGKTHTVVSGKNLRKAPYGPIVDAEGKLQADGNETGVRGKVAGKTVAKVSRARAGMAVRTERPKWGDER